MSTPEIVIFYNPFLPDKAIEHQILLEFCNLFKSKSIIKEVALEHTSKHNPISVLDCDEPVNNVYGHYPFLFFNNTYILKHEIIQFCVRRFCLEESFTAGQKETIKGVISSIVNALGQLSTIKEGDPAGVV